MSENAFNMQADKALTRDLEKATTPEEIRALLHNSLERSGIAARNPETGQFERRDPLTPAAQTEDEPTEITKVEKIGGREITFTGTESEIEKQIIAAYKGADAVKSNQPVTVRSVRAAIAKTQAEREREIVDRTELDLQFRRGQLTTQEYLEKTNSIGEYLEAKGFDVQAAADSQTQAAWAAATTEFLASSDWPGGDRNREQLGLRLIAMGLTDAQDKVGALNAAYQSMRESNSMFDDVSPEQARKLTESMSPQQIIEEWKKAQADPEAANVEFLRLHSNGRSGIFDR